MNSGSDTISLPLRGGWRVRCADWIERGAASRVLGGSIVFVVLTLSVGLGDLPHAQEFIFLGSAAVIVFLLCGLWHGASWTFVLWGIWHGLFLVVERAGLEAVLARAWRPLRSASCHRALLLPDRMRSSSGRSKMR